MEKFIYLFVSRVLWIWILQTPAVLLNLFPPKAQGRRPLVNEMLKHLRDFGLIVFGKREGSFIRSLER